MEKMKFIKYLFFIIIYFIQTSIYLRTIIGHLIHPFTKFALLLEHGCEKTHNGVIQQELINKNMDISKFGWAR